MYRVGQIAEGAGFSTFSMSIRGEEAGNVNRRQWRIGNACLAFVRAWRPRVVVVEREGNYGVYSCPDFSATCALVKKKGWFTV